MPKIKDVTPKVFEVEVPKTVAGYLTFFRVNHNPMWQQARKTTHDDGTLPFTVFRNRDDAIKECQSTYGDVIEIKVVAVEFEINHS